jgi:hypothetical protein
MTAVAVEVVEVEVVEVLEAEIAVEASSFQIPCHQFQFELHQV